MAARIGADDVDFFESPRPELLFEISHYLYEAGRAGLLIASARRRSWKVDASPHLAFFNSHRSQRPYLDPPVGAEEYARRWQEEDRAWIGRHPAEDVEHRIWPWLEERGYAAPADGSILERFLAILGRRRFVDLRPGLRVRRVWGTQEIRALGGDRRLADAIRRDVDAILAAAGEPGLPASR